MKHSEEKFIKHGVVIPLIIAVAVTALFFAVYNIALKSYVFKERNFSLSDYTFSQVNEAEQQNITPKNNEIQKSELTLYGDNTVIGNAVIYDSSTPIIFKGNDVNGAGRFNITDFSKLPGEAGCVYMYCNKKDSSAVKMLTEGDVISVETYYGIFDYEMRETLLVDNDSDLKKCADAYGRSMVIYTDAGNGYGLSNSYYAVIAELISDDVVVE